MLKKFEGKVSVITGAGGGIGEAIAWDLASNGAKVLLVDVNDHVETVADALRKNGNDAVAYRADITIPDESQGIVEKAVKEFGALHFAVNNAGISGNFNDLANVEVQDWRRVMAVNLDAIFYGMKYQLPAIEKAGGGAVVNTASIYGGHLGLTRLDAYTASKSGVLGLTRSVAIEYATRGIRINAVSPGPISTPLSRGENARPDEIEAMKARTDAIAATTAMKRLGKPVEIAKTVSFLLSSDASFITGIEIVVDGGVILS